MARVPTDELARRLADQLRSEGGFSVDVHGQPAKGPGHMVSKVGAEQVVPGYASSQVLATYMGLHPDPGKGGFYGAWYDEGKTYLDVSQRFAGNPREYSEAQLAVDANKQLAAYDLDTDESWEPQQHSLPNLLEPNSIQPGFGSVVNPRNVDVVASSRPPQRGLNVGPKDQRLPGRW